MLFAKKLYRLITIFCLVVMLGNTMPVFATEVPADESETAADPDATPAPEPEHPPAYTEPIQTNEIANWPEGPAVYAESALVMDADTGTILYAKNIDDQKYPASITKIMTALVAIENSKPHEFVVFSDHAIWGIERNSSHIGIRIGEIITMKDCLYGMMLASANEVCLAVAEHIAGDVDTFVDMMNKKAAELGCTGTNFTNPHGLPDDNHYTTAADMAIIAKAAFENELFREITATKAYKIGWTNRAGEDRWLGNHHKMLWDNSSHYYESCVGGKTGFTDVALNTLVTYATRDERTLICVSLRTNGARIYYDTATMLDYAFQNFHNVTVDNTKKADYRAYFMPFPALLMDCYSLQTHNDLLRDIRISIPIESSPDEITQQDSVDAENSIIKRTLLYNDYTVGTDIIHQPEGVKNVLHRSPRFTNTDIISTPIPTPTPATGLAGIKEKTSSMITQFEELPSWKYPLIALFFLLLSLLIIKICFAIKRAKHKHNQ